MRILRQAGYYVYKKICRVWPFATASNFLYCNVLNRCKEAYILGPQQDKKLIRAAFLCDEMTWQDFRKECRSIFVTPRNWKHAFEEFSPQVFFCESAWSGIESCRDCWRGRVYRSKNIRYENRRELLDILGFCREKGITTVFWNKEDPTFFQNPDYDFVDTALRFDYIFTSAEECIPGYQKLGHKRVSLLTFGFSPDIFYPKADLSQSNTAIFAGSWYNDQPHRCLELEALFDMVLEQGIELIIYNRQSDSANPLHRFPDRYRRYLRPKLPFEQLGEVFRQSKYAININTVTDSNTMFARRVFELMACGCIVISNRSVGMECLFPQGIWILDDAWKHMDEEHLRRNNLRMVFDKYTCGHLLNNVWKTIGIKDKVSDKGDNS